MRVAIVRYRVKEGKTEENQAFIDAVFKELDKARPVGVRYASTLAEDGVTFTHIASFTSAEAQKFLTELPEFKAFQKDLGDRCDEPPVPVFGSTVGNYGIF
jgi:predicted flap endonuclease-1-like 5' DNA nuclease